MRQQMNAQRGHVCIGVVDVLGIFSFSRRRVALLVKFEMNGKVVNTEHASDQFRWKRIISSYIFHNVRKSFKIIPILSCTSSSVQ